MLKRFSLSQYTPGDCLLTRDEREVLALEIVNDPSTHFFPIEVSVRVPHTGGVVKYTVNQNGRRYINTRSADDIFFATNARRRGGSDDDGRVLDCMPEPLRAIEGVRKGDLSQVFSANKDSKKGAAASAVRVATIDPHVISKFD